MGDWWDGTSFLIFFQFWKRDVLQTLKCTGTCWRSPPIKGVVIYKYNTLYMYICIHILLTYLCPSFLPFQSPFQLGSHVFKHHQCGPGESFYFAIPWSASWRIFFVATTSLQAQGENHGYNYNYIRYGTKITLTSSWWLTSEDLRIDLMIFSHQISVDVGLGFEVPVWFLTRGWHLVLWNVCLGQWKPWTWLWWANEFQSCWTLCEEIGGWMVGFWLVYIKPLQITG